jgi:peptide/nickel transport system permease protein
MARLLMGIALLVLVMFLLPALLTLWSKGLDPYAMQQGHEFERPGTHYWLGTDSFGRNVGARLVAAASLTLQAITAAVVTSLVLGVLIGAVAGWFYGTLIDRVIGWVISLIYTVPFYLIAVAVAAITRPGLVGAFFILGLLAWAAPARLVRAEMIQLRQSQYVTALRSAGFPERFILWRVLLPMASAPGAVAVTLFVPELIGVEVGLSFFGLGPQPPTPSLGRELYYGLSFIGSAPWLVWAPALTILIVVLAFFGLGRLLAKTLPSRTQN